MIDLSGSRMLRIVAWAGRLAVCVICVCTPALAWPPDPVLSPSPSSTAPPADPHGVAPPESEAIPAPPVVRVQNADSEPERIARLQRTLQSDASRLEELKRLLDDPNGDYARAESAFNEIDKQLAEKKKALLQAMTEGNGLLTQQLQTELADVEKKWSQTKKEFQLAIEQRKARQASIPTLEAKLAKDQQALAQLRGNDPAPAVQTGDPATVPQPGAVATPPPAAPILEASPTTPLPGQPALTPTEPPANGEAPPTDPTKANGAPSAAPNGEVQKATDKPKPDKRVVEAEIVAAKSEAAAQKAENDAASLTERLNILRQDIELERRLRSVATGKISVARDLLNDLNGQLERKVAAGESVTDLRREIRQAENSLVAAQTESERISEHLDELQTELSVLQSEQVAALQEAEQKRQEAEAAQQAVAALNSPFSMHNILNWLAYHGVKIVLVLLTLGLVMWAGTLLEDHLVALIAYRSTRGDDEERENRAKTLVSVLHNALRTVAFGAAGVMILDECGVPVGPILGGAAVVGLAVAFGAQSLIKDYFTGFMILMEQQYMIGDVVQIGDVTAKVERITLRMTIMRDLEGHVHFIPHGQITTVNNLTHEWARAVFDIGVAYKENVDRVIGVLMDLSREFQQDPSYSYMVLEDPVMLGVDQFGDSAVVIKFMIKTRPLSHWDVKREMLRRIKNRFDELNIEIPFPHRTLYLANPPAAWTDPVGQPPQSRENGKAA